jgi:hypothetical protein
MRYLYCSVHTPCHQPTTCNITNHVICLVLRSRLFELPQACKTPIVSLVFCSLLPYQNVLYYYKCAVCSLQYRKENKVFYRLSLSNRWKLFLLLHLFVATTWLNFTYGPFTSVLHMYSYILRFSDSIVRRSMFCFCCKILSFDLVGIEKQTYKICFMPKASVGLLSSTNIYKQSPWESFYSYRGTNSILVY